MSIDTSRTYIIPIERLRDAFEAAVEIAPPSKEPRGYTITLPDGSAVAFPFEPKQLTPYELRGDTEWLSFDFVIRASGDDIAAYVRREPDPPFVFKRLKSGGLRAIVSLFLVVAIEPPFASITFHTSGSVRDCDVLDLRSVCDVLDYVGRCAARVMGEIHIVDPIEAKVAPLTAEEQEREASHLVKYVSDLREGRAGAD